MHAGRPKTVVTTSDRKMAPPKKEEAIEKLTKSVQDLKLEFKNIMKESEKRREESWNELMTEIKLMREKHEVERKEWQKEKEELNERIERLEFDREKKEREEKRQNIVIKGANFENDNLVNSVKEFIKEKVKVEAKIKKAFNIRTKENKKVTVVQLESIEKKKEVMKNKKNIGPMKVFIDDDLTWKEREIQSKIREMAKKKRQEGREVRVSYMKLMVDGKWIKWNEYKNKFEESNTNVRRERSSSNSSNFQ